MSCSLSLCFKHVFAVAWILSSLRSWKRQEILCTIISYMVSKTLFRKSITRTYLSAVTSDQAFSGELAGCFHVAKRMLKSIMHTRSLRRLGTDLFPKASCFTTSIYHCFQTKLVVNPDVDSMYASLTYHPRGCTRWCRARASRLACFVGCSRL